MPDNRRRLAAKIATRYYYTHNDLLFKMLEYWSANPMQIKFVYSQHSGNWGPWYHVTTQVLNPITKKWIFTEKRGHQKKTKNLNLYGGRINEVFEY